MFKRLFFGMVGLGAGVAVGAWTVRRVEAAQRRLSPEQLRRRTAARADVTRSRWAQAIEEGKAAAAAKEAELRGVYRVNQPPTIEPRPPTT